MDTETRILKKEYYNYIIPSIVSQVVFTAYVIVDGIFVARGVSESALAAINIAAPFMTFLWALSLAFAAGTSTVAARLMGEDRLDEARRVFSRNMAAMAVIGVLISVLVLIFLNPFCELLGATDSTREYLKTYIGTVAPFVVFFIASYTFEILTATDGYPRLATYTVSIGVVANVVLDWLLIFVWDRGVWGAAIATAISQVLVIIAYILHFCGKRANIRFCRFKVNRDAVRDVGACLVKGVPSGVTEFSSGLVTLIFVYSIQICLGDNELIAFSAAGYISQLLLFVFVGIAQGSQPLLSYYNGAGEQDSIDKLMRFQFRTIACLGAVVASVMVLFADPLAKVFITSGEALSTYTVFVLKRFLVASLIAGFNVVIASYFTSMEKPGRGVIISLGRCSVMLIIGIVISAKLFGPDGIWWGMAIGEAFNLIMATILYRNE